MPCLIQLGRTNFGICSVARIPGRQKQNQDTQPSKIYSLILWSDFAKQQASLAP
jgi:hypothetical protein